jgi:hypothetical protein
VSSLARLSMSSPEIGRNKLVTHLLLCTAQTLLSDKFKLLKAESVGSLQRLCLQAHKDYVDDDKYSKGMRAAVML